MTMPTETYVISDLHLGGAPATDGGRGFRMCTQGARLATFVNALAQREERTELVIAGDFVDFLAEKTNEGDWSAFRRDSAEVCRVLDQIVSEREPQVFQALGSFLQRGHRLTILLGNHDVELALPAVRTRLTELLASDPRADLGFIYDNEGYVVKNVLIEHGNRADPYNEVDHDKLRRLRVLQSRRSDTSGIDFEPPVGSKIVAELMNPLKERLPFIDLLKPESAGMIPVLVALCPGTVQQLPGLLRYLGKGKQRDLLARVGAVYSHDIAGGPNTRTSPAPKLEDVIRDTLPPEEANLLIDSLGIVPRTTTDISSGIRSLGVESARRIQANVVSMVLRPLLRDDRTFDTSAEKGAAYRDAAKEAIGRGFSGVIFGHTHFAVREQIETTAGVGTYVNTGTWADLMQLPPELLDEDWGVATQALQVFLERVGEGDLDAWILRKPTYARIHPYEGGGVNVGLYEYREDDPASPSNVVAE